jgi:hypothetical protein
MPVERTFMSDRAFRIVANHKIRAAGTGIYRIDPPPMTSRQQA